MQSRLCRAARIMQRPVMIHGKLLKKTTQFYLHFKNDSLLLAGLGAATTNSLLGCEVVPHAWRAPISNPCPFRAEKRRRGEGMGEGVRRGKWKDGEGHLPSLLSGSLEGTHHIVGEGFFNLPTGSPDTPRNSMPSSLWDPIIQSRVHHNTTSCINSTFLLKAETLGIRVLRG